MVCTHDKILAFITVLTKTWGSCNHPPALSRDFFSLSLLGIICHKYWELSMLEAKSCLFYLPSHPHVVGNGPLQCDVVLPALLYIATISQWTSSPQIFIKRAKVAPLPGFHCKSSSVARFSIAMATSQVTMVTQNRRTGDGLWPCQVW